MTTIDAEAEVAEPTYDEMAQHGRLTWHSSVEGGGPDCGYSLGLGNGRMLYVGEMSITTYGENPNAHHLGDDNGWWIILYGKHSTQVIGKVADSEAASVLMEDLGFALRFGLTLSDTAKNRTSR